MSDLPRFGQYAQKPRAEMCPRHPGTPAVGYCKRCNRPTCSDCTIPTEVGTICVDCANPRSRRRFTLAVPGGQPVVTYAVLILNALIFVLGKIWPAIYNALAFNPAAAYTQPWRFITSGFVHIGFFHLFFNMLMLYIIGAAVEKAAGRWRFVCLYLLSIMGGSMAILGWVYADNQSLLVVTVGASGALYGLLGAVFVEQRLSGMSTTAILVLLGINLAFSFINAGSVSWQAHIGGLIVGALVAWMYLVLSRPRPGMTERKQTLWSIAATAGVCALLAGITVGLYQGLMPLLHAVGVA
ncbi:rhomboid family intramembrane serine protease [Scrofimicrobium canadense]|nr:rhomboid family intramembrane serine protease [Scrofimicrobium canadense]